MSSVYSMHRPGFWRVPKFKTKEPQPTQKKKVHFYDEFVQPNSPANSGLIRGDIITKVGDYDARDLRHEDAQMLFRTQDQKIRLVVRRDNRVAMNSGKSNPISSLPPPPFTPQYRPIYDPEPYALSNRTPSPLPRGNQNAYASPIDSLPHTSFSNGQPQPVHHQPQQQSYQPQQQQNYQPVSTPPKPAQHVNYPPPPPPRTCFSPQLTRDNFQSFDDENSAIQNQPYRSTPLILPGAKNCLHTQRNLPTESYLRHHPNPQMRGPPTHDFNDIMMKQKVADSVLQRYGGEEPATNGPKLVHKQFNSPIGLYSDNLIESTIKNTVSPAHSVASANSVPHSPNGTLSRQSSHQQQRPTKIQGYKPTVVYDPLKSETYRALQENSFAGERAHEVTTPIQPRVFQPNRCVPGKKPTSFPPPDPQTCSMSRHPVNSLGEPNDHIHQSGSFKRLMYHVLGETDY